MNKSYEEIKESYLSKKSLDLKLNMARGNPSKEQLDLNGGFFTIVDEDSYISKYGVDTRNYGEATGLRETKELMAQIGGFENPENVIITGSTSLNAMYDSHVRLLITKPTDGESPWYENKKRKCLCPSPGYDRHFNMTEALGYELIKVDMKDDGPDMDQVEELVKNDPDIKCIWCVPKYSNPTGITYSMETCKRLVSMETASSDFKIFWDNAYSVHHLDPENYKAQIPDIVELAKKYGNENRVFCFSSTSKITFAGGGIACFYASDENVAWFKRQLNYQMICTDKVNQLRHARFFPNFQALEDHMKDVSKILKPKFDAVVNTLERNFSDRDDVSWTNPKGGYFIGLSLPKGCASRVVDLAKEAGMILTPAGACFPYGKDEDDYFLRIAPSFPPLEDIEKAADLLCSCIDLAIAEKNM